jgi:hypothetical protein
MEIFEVFPIVSFRGMSTEISIFAPKSIEKSAKLLQARFLPLLGGGLEPAFRVLFSAIFHGVSLRNFHQGSNRRKVAEEKL